MTIYNNFIPTIGSNQYVDAYGHVREKENIYDCVTGLIANFNNIKHLFTRRIEMTLGEKDLLNRFTYHAPSERDVVDHESIRNFGLDLARILNDVLPDSREKSLAITKLEESIMWANAAIARNK